MQFKFAVEFKFAFKFKCLMNITDAIVDPSL